MFWARFEKKFSREKSPDLPDVFGALKCASPRIHKIQSGAKAPHSKIQSWRLLLAKNRT
jgi:hypothetical protein